jgi:arylsulfatase A-like enzyme
MKFNRFFVLSAALLQIVPAVRAENPSLASIFTNAPGGAHARTAMPRRSSIIFIACHGLGCGDLNCYGQTNFQTPNLDRLAAEGTRFTDYRAAGDELPPAQAALLAGKNGPLAPGETNLAQRLQLAGYHTGLLGEWTLGAQPWTQGFDEFAGFISEQEAKNYYSDFIWRYSPRSVYDETNQTLEAWTGREMIFENTGGKRGRYLPDVLLGAAANFVRVNVPDYANHYRPFFLLVNLPAPRSATDGKDDFPVPTDAPFSGEPWPQAAKNRAALITRLDDGVGRLIEQLNKLGMTNNVAIFFTGAVAPEKFAATNLNFLKLAGEVRGGSSEARLRVPMIVRWPEHVPAGRVSSQPWSTVDFAPTALQIGYGKPAPGITGISMLPALLGQPGMNTNAAPDRLDMPARQF